MHKILGRDYQRQGNVYASENKFQTPQPKNFKSRGPLAFNDDYVPRNKAEIQPVKRTGGDVKPHILMYGYGTNEYKKKVE